MNTNASWFPGRLHDLDAQECAELLASRVTGRIAYCDDDGPVVVPVNYGFADGNVLIRIAPYSQLAQHLREEQVAFQIDDFDDFNQSGWSVLVRGRADFVEVDDLPASGSRPQPWAGGHRPLFVRITVRSMTGRRLLAS